VKSYRLPKFTTYTVVKSANIGPVLAEGEVPAQFKIGRVHPIHKEKEKPREDPGSYRPVSILLALSKILESLMKGDLEGHLKRVNGLPGSQYGFRHSNVIELLGVRYDRKLSTTPT
jgi:hypothetical protein